MARLRFKPIAYAGGDLEELGDYKPLLPNRALAPTFQNLPIATPNPHSGPMWTPSFLLSDDDLRGSEVTSHWHRVIYL